MQQIPVTACERCGAPVTPGQLVCPNCGALVHQRRLEELANQALRLEAVNPVAAASVWRTMLDLLPSDSQQYAYVYRRMAALAGGQPPHAAALPGGPWSVGAREIPQAARSGAVPLEYASPVRPPDPLPVAVAKTVGSMAVSILVYYYMAFGNMTVAVGFVVLMLVHEMGHVLAMRYYGLSASPPIFIPFVGALINLRQQPRNALVESVVGIGGPLLGTIGAFVCYAIAVASHGIVQQELAFVAYLAFLLNLFNLLPVPPLDGGRVTAAISPWLWIVGLIGLAWFMVVEARRSLAGLIIPVLILMYALPRIMVTLRQRGRDNPYYRVSRQASWTMAALYVLLGVALAYMFHRFGGFTPLRHWAS